MKVKDIMRLVDEEQIVVIEDGKERFFRKWDKEIFDKYYDRDLFQISATGDIHENGWIVLTVRGEEDGKTN